MSEEQLKAFIAKVQGDTSLQEQLKAAADTDAVLAIAKEAGFSISVDDINKAQSELSEEERELSDEELEGVAGGLQWGGWGAFGEKFADGFVRLTIGRAKIGYH